MMTDERETNVLIDNAYGLINEQLLTVRPSSLS